MRPSMSRPLRNRAVCALLVAGVLSVVSACGGDADPIDAATRDPGPEHVHGLGLNPADGALYIATHTGLFRMAPGSQDAERVGDRLQDTMGFAIAGPDRFLGSGHPDLRDDLPPHLGLIESTDAGRSWEPISLLGEADFHALHVDGSHVTGYDASGGRLMLSADGGRTWRSSSPPAAVGDVVVDPADSRRLVAAGADGLLRSPDAGATWSRLAGAPIALAWPTAGALYSVAADGTVRASADGGDSWVARADLPGEPAAVTATGEDSLIVALHDGSFASSADGGRSWSPGPWAAGQG